MRVNRLPIFLSVVFVLENQASCMASTLGDTVAILDRLVSDYELIVVDNASTDDSILELKKLTAQGGLPNLQIYALTKSVDEDTASWVGIENALGDFVAILNPLVDSITFLPEMLKKAMEGSDVVFAENLHRSTQSLSYRFASWIFERTYKRFNGVELSKDAPPYRVISKRVVNFILQHSQPSHSYRHLPATAGFARSNLTYSAVPRVAKRKRLSESIDRGTRMLVSSTRAPMRLVTALSLFGAVANLVYCVYILIVGLFKDHVAEGWVSLSLQQSGMFFLISLVLFVLGEYILQMASLSNEGPLFHVGQELTSSRITRREKLNVVDIHEDEKSVGQLNDQK